MTETPAPASPARDNPTPASILVAASLVAVEATLLILLGLAEILAVDGDRVVMGVTTAVFFLMYGGGLVVCAWSVSRLKSWARAPVVVAQLIQVLVAWSFLGGSSTPVAVVLGAVAILVLVALFRPDSMAALNDDR